MRELDNQIDHLRNKIVINYHLILFREALAKRRRKFKKEVK